MSVFVSQILVGVWIVSALVVPEFTDQVSLFAWDSYDFILAAYEAELDMERMTPPQQVAMQTSSPVEVPRVSPTAMSLKESNENNEVGALTSTLPLTPTPTDESILTPSVTSNGTQTATLIFTSASPSTATSTSVIPSPTSLPPSNTPVPSNTPLPTSTATAKPTNTRSPSATPPNTLTATAAATSTPVRTHTPTPTSASPSPTETSSGPQPTPTVDLSGCSYNTQSSIENQVLALLNLERENVGLPPLIMQNQLRGAAREHSADMACNDFVSHTGSNGTSSYDRITSYGYYPSWWGENIYMGYQTTPEQVVTWWMNSTPHRNNILHSYYVHIGIGQAVYGNTIAYSLNFGRP